MKLSAIILYLLFLTSFADSQELKKIFEKQDNSSFAEEYFVLKEDKSIKHGKYLKYYERLLVEKYIKQFGSYDHNQKTGVWFLFNIAHPQNPLNIVGEYSNGEKTGPWFYFYPPELKDTSVLSLLGYKKLTGVIIPKRKDQEFQITIDTTGVRLAATGNFESNKKTGKWSYYSKEGQLIKEYDFSANKIISGVRNDSVSFYMLGGMTQFHTQLNEILFEEIQKINVIQPSNVKYEIIVNENTLFVNNLTATIG
ncbi:MAG: hypothetical protein WAL29_10810, partial [Bacteroidales bacterium]